MRALPQVEAVKASSLVIARTTRNAALAVAHSIDPSRQTDGFGALLDRIQQLFARFELARRTGSLMLGLLSGLDPKN